MTVTHAIAEGKDALPIILTLGGLLVAWHYFFPLAPKIALQLSPRWMDGNPKIGILTLKVTNTSKVRIRKKRLSLQILFYPVARMENLGEWVPFKDDYTSEWRPPKKICTTTKYIYPGETMTVDYPIIFPDLALIAHVGLQFRAKLSLPQRILCNYWFRPQEQWTTTMFVWPECRQDCKNSPLGDAAS